MEGSWSAPSPAHASAVIAMSSGGDVATKVVESVGEAEHDVRGDSKEVFVRDRGTGDVSCEGTTLLEQVFRTKL